MRYQLNRFKKNLASKNERWITEKTPKIRPGCLNRCKFWKSLAPLTVYVHRFPVNKAGDSIELTGELKGKPQHSGWMDGYRLCFILSSNRYWKDSLQCNSGERALAHMDGGNYFLFTSDEIRDVRVVQGGMGWKGGWTTQEFPFQ